MLFGLCLIGLWADSAESGIIHPASTGEAGVGSATIPGQSALHADRFVLNSAIHVQSTASTSTRSVDLTSLEARHDLNPTRFDHFHPLIGPTIGEIERLQAGFCAASDSSVNVLLARRLINPTRFDSFHPVLGPLLAKDYQLRAVECMNCPPLNGILPLNAFFNALRLRRSLNPARFDHFHPTLGRLLAEDALLRNNLGLCMMTPNMPEIVLPPGSGSSNNGGNPPPPSVPPPPLPPPPPPPTGSSVPEPAGIILLLIGSIPLAALGSRRPWLRSISR